MNGELAQLAALVAHGNSALDNPGTAFELVTTNSSFRFVNEVQFSFPGAETVHDCRSWWAGLKQRGNIRVLLTRYPPRSSMAGFSEHHQAAFAGGMATAILALTEQGAVESWIAQWAVTQPRHPDQRIWSVLYHGDRARYAERPAPPLETAYGALTISLEEIRAFAAQENLEFWLPWFTGALELLSSSSPASPYHHDLLPAIGYSLRTRQILSAAERGWVFGGMGSWNDIGSRDQARYEEVTQTYFDAVMNGVIAAVNAYMPGSS